MIVFDSNVLVYAINADALQHTASRSVIEAVGERKLAGVLFPQNILEFYAIVTDQRRIRHALQPVEAWEQVQILSRIFSVLQPAHEALEFLARISEVVHGPNIFDAYLVAQMMAAGISTICTYNTKHFEAFTGIVKLTPDELLVTINGDS